MTESQQNKIQSSFARKKKTRVTLMAIFIILTVFLAFPAILVGIFMDNQPLLLGLGLVYLVSNAALGIQFLVAWRCPACNKQLGRDINILFCQYCGQKLVNDSE